MTERYPLFRADLVNDMLRGISASKGYGIGKAMVIREVSLEYESVRVTDTRREIERFNAAVKDFCSKTRRLAQRMKAVVGEKEGDILLGHITMAQDPYMISEIEGKIKGGECAEAALESVCDMFIKVFSSADDELTKQRATDVRDIKRGILSILLGREERDITMAPENTILIVKELTPSMTAAIVKKNIVGIVTEMGGSTSHSAIIARAMEIPAVLSVSGALSMIEDGARIIVDGSSGVVIADPGMPEIDSYTKKRAAYIEEKKTLYRFAGKPTKTLNGRKLELLCNISRPEEAARALERDGEGIGLFRTEFLFMDRSFAPGEEEQFEAYKKAALIMKGRPVTIRTIDIGGDKNIPYLNITKEENPFLGFRGVRYCLKNRGLFLKQLRAILRASAYGEISIMIPLITAAEEVREVKRLIGETKEQLRECGFPYKEDIKVGIMIETPAAVMLARELAKEADFFSIGTNDLTQYIMAVDRGNADVAYLNTVYQPAVLRGIHHAIICAKEAGIPVGMCGEAAADEGLIPLLVAWGLDKFSVSPSAVLSTRRTIASWSAEKAQDMAKAVLAAKTEDEVRKILKDKK